MIAHCRKPGVVAIRKSAAVDKNVLVATVMFHDITDIGFLECHLLFRRAYGGKKIAYPANFLKFGIKHHEF